VSHASKNLYLAFKNKNVVASVKLVLRKIVFLPL